MGYTRLTLASLPLALLLGNPPAGRDVERLAWMAGCWELDTGQRTVEEQWMAPRGGAMIGMSRTVRADRLVGWELVVIRKDSAGLAYHAFPSGQAPAVFPATEVSDSHVVFANPAHDFPQRVIYRLRGDTLAARVEAGSGAAARGSDFPYRRVACPGKAGGGDH